MTKWDAGAATPSKPAPGRLEAIEAQIRDEIALAIWHQRTGSRRAFLSPIF
jgi:hypothetical protein